MKTIESYLPIFTGYYNTLFDSELAEDMVIESENLNFDSFEFDYKEYMDRVAEKCVSSVWNFLKNDGFEIDIIFDKVYSPRFYNYSNDSIYCDYKVSGNDINRLVQYCKDNLIEFKTFLEENYSSYDGFISFLDTDAEIWFKNYLNEDNRRFENAFIGILEFYLTNEGYSKDQMLDDVADETSFIEYKILEG